MMLSEDAPREDLPALFDAKDFAGVVRQVARMGFDDAVRVLASCPMAAIDGNGDTVLHVAAEFLHRNDPLPEVHAEKVFRALIAAGAGIDAADAHGNTPLIRAVANWFHAPHARNHLQRNARQLAMLMTCGADPSLRNARGEDALAVAVSRGAHPAVHALLRAGAAADAMAPHDGATALRHLVARSNAIPMRAGQQVTKANVRAAVECTKIALALAIYGASGWDSRRDARYDTMCSPWFERTFAQFRTPPASAAPSRAIAAPGAAAMTHPQRLLHRIAPSYPPPLEGSPETRAAAMLHTMGAGTPCHEISDAELRAVVRDGYFNQDGYYVFEGAIRGNEPDLVWRMLRWGADPNGEVRASGSCVSYLALAASAGRPSTVMALLHHGARDWSPSALQAAAHDPHMLRALVHSGMLHASPPQIAQQAAAGAARLAAEWGLRDSLQFLLEFLPDAGQPPHRFAARRADLDGVGDPRLRAAMNAATVHHSLMPIGTDAPRIAPAPSRDIALAFATVAYAPRERTYAAPPVPRASTRAMNHRATGPSP